MTSEEAGPLVRSRVVRGVAMVSLNLPPANALTPALRRAVWDKVAGLEANSVVRAIVLLAEGRVFSVGVDRTVPEPAGADAPGLAELCARIEDCERPVIAVLQGPALAGGAELAMAAHYRLAAEGATVGLPEIALGLVPGGGGGQRLTRLIGADPALRMMLSGKSVTAETARELGLVDGVLQGEAASGGHAYATALLERGAGPRRAGQARTHLSDGTAVMAAVAKARAALPAGSLLAAHRAVDCVEAALLLPYPSALEFEAAAFEDCAADPESRALRHVQAAERGVSAGLIVADGKGGRSLTEPARAAVQALLAAQDRALVWLVANGTPEAAVDATFLDWGFARAPFGATVMPGGQGPERAVRARVLAAMAGAGAGLVEAGRIESAADIDALAVHGMGYPRRAGGPMKEAELTGLPGLVRQMSGWALEDPVWQAPGLMAAASRLAGGFAAVKAETVS